jgi:membrane protein implicated in regulation of membrane protease activity
MMPAPTDPPGFSRAEIAAVVLGLAIPLVLFALLLIPGAMAAVIGYLTQRHVAPWAFGGAAVIVAAILVRRIWTRVRRRRRR